MASSEFDDPDVPACPFLGLAGDRRSHYTYPHPDHRCYASDRGLPTDPARQTTFCLGAYATCDRYLARQRQAQPRASGRPIVQALPMARPTPPASPMARPFPPPPEPPTATAPAHAPATRRPQTPTPAAPKSPATTPPAPTVRASAPPAGEAPPGTVIHVYRAGDSLVRIARVHDLTVEQLAIANGLSFDAILEDGTRLLIPLDPGAVDPERLSRVNRRGGR